MEPSRSQIDAALKPVLKAAGYKKRNLTWHRSTTFAVLVFNVQASQWSDAYYLNAGLYLRELGDEERPPEYRCHVRTRIDRLLPDPRTLFRALDFEQAMEDEARYETIVGAVQEYGLPWLDKMSNRQELCGELERLNPVMVHKDVLTRVCGLTTG